MNRQFLLSLVLKRLSSNCDLVFGQGARSVEEEAEWLVRHALEFKLSLSSVETLIARRLSGEPMAYVTGRVRLCDLDFKTDSRAIIPRSYLAELIADGRLRSTAPKTLLDLCCGNANLAIAAALRIPSLERVVASDISSDALDLARENLEMYPKVVDRVHLVQSDLFHSVQERFDMILCNMPYVKDAAALPREFKHEPQLALFGGRDGLEIVRRILPSLRSHLNPNGVAVLEVGFGQVQRMKALWPGCEFLETSAGKGPVVMIKT